MLCPYCEEYDVYDVPSCDGSGMCDNCEEYSIPTEECEERLLEEG